MTNVNPNPFTTRPEIEGTFGVVTSTHWIATAVGMGDAGTRRQRVRRGGRHRVHAAGGRAASQRAGRRRAGHPLRRAPRQAGGDLRSGRGAGRRDDRALPQRRPRHGARHRPARRLRARHVRDLDAAAARLRHHAARRRARAGDRLRAERPSAGRARQCHHRHGRASCSASIGRPRPRSICPATRCRRPERCSPTRRSLRPMPRVLKDAESAGGDRVAQIERARKSGRKDLSPRRSTASAAPRM